MDETLLAEVHLIFISDLLGVNGFRHGDSSWRGKWSSIQQSSGQNGTCGKLRIKVSTFDFCTV